MTLAEWLSQFGASAASFGGAAGYILKRFRVTERNATKALTLATDAVRFAKDARQAVTALQQGLRMELTDFKTEILHRAARVSRGDPDEAGLADIRHKLEELRSDLLRERGARHALQRTIQDDAKEEALQWTALNRELATLNAQVEILMKRLRP